MRPNERPLSVVLLFVVLLAIAGPARAEIGFRQSRLGRLRKPEAAECGAHIYRELLHVSVEQVPGIYKETDLILDPDE